jgi:mono/diheme cytochrome c family protein
VWYTFLLRFSFSVQLFLILTAAAPAFAGQGSQAAARALTSGAEIYQAGCAVCHGPNGEGAPQTSTGFDRPETFPDFTDCAGTTPELDVDWKATITHGGRGRGFSRIMPSFAEELTPEQIDAVVRHLRTLCRDSSWPRGELNLPLPQATEKAFPESETVVKMAVAAHGAPDANGEIVYEHRFGVRNQLELSIPFAMVHDESGTAARGVGDVGIGLKHVLFSSRSSILSAQGELVAPSGNKDKGLGAGVTVFEAFAAFGQILPSNMFLQAQAGTEQPTSTDETPRAIFGRVAFGRSFREELGLGRLWSPMFELVGDRDLQDGAKTNLDVLPQFQVTLSRRQHVRVNLGLQVPVTNTAGRSKHFVFYFLWDWFDGGLLDGWK